MTIDKKEKILYDKGYRVIGNDIFNPKGERMKEPRIGNRGYPIKTFTIGSRSQNTRMGFPIGIHRMVAFQKYGEDIYKDGIEVRHLNGNRLDYSEDNITIGTHQENMLDIPEKKRLRMSKYATSHNRKFTNEEMEDIRNYYNENKSYKLTMAEFNISSKGTLWYMLNKNYVTEKIEKD